MLEQGRQYTTWLYGNQYEKLWNRFSPEMRQTFGSVTDLASFASRAVTRMGREQGAVDERVETRGAVPASTAGPPRSTTRRSGCGSSGV